MNSTIFINKPSNFLEVKVLVFQLRNMFPRNENRFDRLILKRKQRKAMQQPQVFLKFFTNQILLFFSIS